MSLIYLASPYTHEHRSVRYQRFIAVALATAKLMNEDEIVYSPIVHNHTLAELVDLPRKWEFWAKFDEEMLSKADRFIILKLDGWQESVGINAEKHIAKELGLKIEFMEPVE